jgi:hypothetical protein
MIETSFQRPPLRNLQLDTAQSCWHDFKNPSRKPKADVIVALLDASSAVVSVTVIAAVIAAGAGISVGCCHGQCRPICTKREADEPEDDGKDIEGEDCPAVVRDGALGAGDEVVDGYNEGGDWLVEDRLAITLSDYRCMSNIWSYCEQAKPEGTPAAKDSNVESHAAEDDESECCLNDANGEYSFAIGNNMTPLVRGHLDGNWIKVEY